MCVEGGREREGKRERERERERKKARNRVWERDIERWKWFKKAYVGDSNRQPQPSRENLEREIERERKRETDRQICRQRKWIF